MDPAEDLLLHQSKLLPRRQLPLAGETGETGQVVHVPLRPPNPVRRVDIPATAGTPRSVPSAQTGLRKASCEIKIYKYTI